MEKRGKKMIIEYLPFGENKLKQMVVTIPTERQFNLVFPDVLLGQRIEQKLLEEMQLQKRNLREGIRRGLNQLKELHNELRYLQSKISELREERKREEQKKIQHQQSPTNLQHPSIPSIHYHYYYPIDSQRFQAEQQKQQQQQQKPQPEQQQQSAPQEHMTSQQQQELQQQPQPILKKSIITYQQQQPSTLKNPTQQLQPPAKGLDLTKISSFPFARVMLRDVIRQKIPEPQQQSDASRVKKEVLDSPQSPSPSPPASPAPSSSTTAEQVSPMNLTKKRSSTEMLKNFTKYYGEDRMITRFKSKKLKSIN